ncbi:conserved hypothetical protein [Trichinella spiralis]|uniref:hypothetical protein n=1 Tax=Trichinella spiralis TaxID=6334 RepID=UPI0001EFB77A|nr:conserved hypothetical protein [Trichinella spiralis]
MDRFETPLGGTKPLHRWSSAWTAETTILTRSRLVDFLINFLPEIMHAHQFHSFKYYPHKICISLLLARFTRTKMTSFAIYSLFCERTKKKGYCVRHYCN